MVATPVIFLPGSLCDERLFADQIEELDDPCETADLTLDDSVEAMAARVLSQAPPRFALVGLSLGGIVGAEIARLVPERVAGLALLDTNLDAPEEAQLRTRRRWAADVRAGHFDRVVEGLVPSMTTAPETHGPLIVDMAMSVGPAGFLRQNDALLTRPDRRAIVSTVPSPILIACGREDQPCPPSLHAELVGRAPTARMVVVEHAGHLSTIDQPKALTSAISHWLQTCKTHQSKGEKTNEYTKA